MIRKPYDIFLLAIFFSLFCTFSGFAGENDTFVTLSNVKARPLAMGGAFTSVPDELAAVAYNPAALDLYKVRNDGRLTLFLNPISPFVGAFDRSDLFEGSNSPGDDLLVGLGLFLKSATLSFSAVDVGVLLGEESLNSPEVFENDRIFDAAGYRQNYSHTFFGRLRLADQVSIGASANLSYASTENEPLQRDKGVGISYGVLLRPEKGLKIGVSLINLPDSLNQARLPLERIVDESVNLGISYRLANTMLSLDVRNLGEEQADVVREFHVGLEQIFLANVAVRAGWFRKPGGQDVYSCGLGLFDGNILWGADRQFSQENFLFNYAFVFEKTPLTNQRWHLLSFYIRL